MPHTGSSSNHLEELVEKPSLPQKAAIVAKDIWKSYNGQTILKGLNLTVPEGKTLIILGRSGVGKSVMLRQILGLERPDQGYIEVGGIRITDLKQSELYPLMGQFGMLFQSSALFDSMTLEKNVSFYLDQHGKNIKKDEIKQRVSEALLKVGLEGFEKKMPSELSGGQKRRAALARLIIYQPKIMLYDEPTTGLDPITAMQINELIKQTQNELEATAIVVTHDINSALNIGDLFALHHDGKIHHLSDKEKFITNQDPMIREFFKDAIIPEKYVQLINEIKIKDAHYA
ncbi:MAG: tri-D-galactosyl-diacylglycerol [Chlamydiia bacterium]|nr:tri-D-galactosyl-diacylglycerol [Chlamydiia bacterium]